MAEQLALVAVDPVITLKPRQQLILDAVKRAGQDGLTDDEAGALWHAEKNIHGRDDRCIHCAHTGREILEALKAKGLVTYRRTNRARGIHGGWLATGTQSQQDAAPLPRGMTDRIPY